MIELYTNAGVQLETIDITLKRQISGGCTVNATIVGNVALGDILYVAFTGTYPDPPNQMVFCKVIHCVSQQSGLSQVSLIEDGDDLNTFVMEVGGSRTITIDNSAHDKTILDYVEIILTGTGWTEESHDTSVYIPHTTDYLPSMRFSNTFVKAALEKFLIRTCGYKIWTGAVTGRLYYGDIRTDRTSETLIPQYIRKVSSDMNYNISRVIVKGSTMAIEGVAIKTGATAPYKTLMYQYQDAMDATECEKIAEQILNDRQYSAERYEADVIPNDVNIEWKDGDNIHVHSDTYSLNGNYGIKDVTITKTGMTVGLGYPEVTIFDLLGSKLVQISGESETGTEITWDGGWQHVSPGITTGPAKWILQIDDLDLIGDTFTFLAHLHKWVKDLSTLPSLAAMLANREISGVLADRVKAGMTAARTKSAVVAVRTKSAVTNTRTKSAVSVDVNNTQSLTTVNGAITTSLNVLIDNNVPNWKELASVTTADTYTNGRHFGLVHCALITYNTSSDWIKWILKISGTSGTSITQNYLLILIPPTGAGSYHTISVSALLGYLTSEAAADKTIYVNAALSDSSQTPTARCVGCTLTVSKVTRHTHNVTEPNAGDGHDTTIIEPNSGAGHDTSVTEPNSGDGHDTTMGEPNSGDGHDTGVDEPNWGAGHDTRLNEPNAGTGHATNEDDNKSEVDSYPTDVDIYVNSVKMNATPFAGGSDQTITQVIPKTAFIVGENTIELRSTVKGSVYGFGLYTQYGE